MDFIKINAADNVAVAITELKKGTVVNVEGQEVVLQEDVPAGHKFALKNFAKGEDVIKYGYPIGHATNKILKGSHVHVSNVKTNLGDELSYSYTQKFVENKYKDDNIKVKVFITPIKDRLDLKHNIISIDILRMCFIKIILNSCLECISSSIIEVWCKCSSYAITITVLSRRKSSPGSITSTFWHVSIL